MQIKKILAVFVAFAAFHVGSAGAAGTFIPSANRVDMVHDAARSTIYIADGGNVVRYHIPTASYLAPIALGGQLSGIDLSPDGTTLAVADRTSTATEQWIYLVRLSDLAVTKATITKEFMEDGMWTVAFGADGILMVTSRFAGSGWVPMRRLNPSTLAWTKVGTAYPDNTFMQNTMVSASGDGK